VIEIVAPNMPADHEEIKMRRKKRGAGLPDGLFSNQKFQIWVNFGGHLNGKCWYIL
jgi:hypothetical protein